MMTERTSETTLVVPDAPATDAELREVALTRAEYELAVARLSRYPARVELGMIGALWSEHCGYKHSRPLFKMFPTTGPRVLQGPGENAGVVDIGDGLALAIKMESHNHPSAVEPYQGAATGVGGIVRDIFTMGAQPVAILDALRFGPLDEARNRYLLNGVVGGIGGYGNSLGVPTVGGEINIHPAYRGSPLVNAMCVGIAPHGKVTRASAGAAGNVLLLVGAATGRDGIHGATFASGDLDAAAMERRPAVQVGNPFLEKLLMDACLELLDTDDVVGMQDLGAAGITSSAVECAGRAGAGIAIDTRKVARRERGMTAYEVMLSESQERMLVIVAPEADELARGAQVGNGSRVADFCAGLGGTVRYLAHKYRADVTGIELTPARVSGAQELTRRVGLDATARIVEGNVMDVPLPDASIDAVVSQEAFCHVPDVKRAVAEAFRILRTDGRLAFTDWIANQPLTAADAQLMWEGMAIQPLRSIPEYRRLVESVGLRVISTKDLTEEWGPILKERLAMYQLLREEARQAGTPMGHDAFHKSYIRFVDLIQKRKMGGVRMVATK